MSPRHSHHTSQSVFLWGEGDRLSPTELLARLHQYHQTVGLEVDHFSLGGTVKLLEEKMASILGKESAVFMPTGTLANHLALRHLCNSQQRVILPEQSHIYNDTGDGLEKLSGIKLIPLGKNKVCFSLNELKDTLKQANTGKVHTPVGAVVIESPVRRQLGQIVAYDEMKRITEYCRLNNIACHLDGARIFMMSVATKIPISQYTALFDTVYVSLYKYLNSPSGAILAGPSELLKPMIQSRRMFGGALWGCYFFAALALEEVTGFQEKLEQAFTKSKSLFSQINDLSGIKIISMKNGSNIFILQLSQDIDSSKFSEALSKDNIYFDSAKIRRNTFTININTSLLRQSNEAIFQSVKSALEYAV